MNRRVFAALLACGAAVLAGNASAQAPYAVPRTSWGDPDLQGIWPSTHMVGVPFERPPEYGDRLYLTEEEFNARQADAARQGSLDLADIDIENPSAEIEALGLVGGPTSPPPHWLERGEPQRQSSLIVDPPNGRLPPMTAAGAERQRGLKNTYLQESGFASYAELGPYDRCISRGVVASMMPVVYNNGNEFVQAPGYVVLRNEMIHETRIVPLDGRPHVAGTIRSYMGDSRGRWDGDTLVVETTNLNGRTGVQGNGMMLVTSDALRLTERFTRTGRDTMQYSVTVDDPGTWTKPWTASFELRLDPTYQLFEYACHEGNHAMRNVLSASRAAERQQQSTPRP